MKNPFENLDITDKDVENMDKFVDDAEEILKQASEDQENRDVVQLRRTYKSLESDSVQDDDTDSVYNRIKKLESELKDDSNEFYSNVEKGTISELFFRTYAEEIPDSGVHIEDDAYDIKGKPLENNVAVKTAPYKTDKDFLFFLSLNHPVISFLTSGTPFVKKDLGKQLESEELLPEGTTDRVITRFYKNKINKGDDFWKDRLKKEGLENTDPLSDEKAKEIIRDIIREEYNKKLGI